MHAYEVGYKFDNHQLSNEAAAFLYNYSNLQVSEYKGNAQAYIINAAESRIYGLEDNFHFELNEHFQVNGGAAWTHARYVQFGKCEHRERRSTQAAQPTRLLCRRDTLAHCAVRVHLIT